MNIGNLHNSEKSVIYGRFVLAATQTLQLFEKLTYILTLSSKDLFQYFVYNQCDYIPPF